VNDTQQLTAIRDGERRVRILQSQGGEIASKMRALRVRSQENEEDKRRLREELADGSAANVLSEPSPNETTPEDLEAAELLGQGLAKACERLDLEARQIDAEMTQIKSATKKSANELLLRSASGPNQRALEDLKRCFDDMKGPIVRSIAAFRVASDDYGFDQRIGNGRPEERFGAACDLAAQLRGIEWMEWPDSIRPDWVPPLYGRWFAWDMDGVAEAMAEIRAEIAGAGEVA
jgi:hypothetical protein